MVSKSVKKVQKQMNKLEIDLYLLNSIFSLKESFLQDSKNQNSSRQKLKRIQPSEKPKRKEFSKECYTKTSRVNSNFLDQSKNATNHGIKSFNIQRKESKLDKLISYQKDSNFEKDYKVVSYLDSIPKCFMINNPFSSKSHPKRDSKLENYVSYHFILDSGASNHMINDRRNLINFLEFSESSFEASVVSTANGEKMAILGSGDLPIFIVDLQKTILLQDVLYIPSLTENLLSIPKISEIGYNTYLPAKSNQMLIFKGSNLNPNNIFFKASKKGSLFYCEIYCQDNAKVNYYQAKLSKTGKGTLDLWHKRLCHPNYNSLKFITKENNPNLTGVMERINFLPTTCTTCIQAKQTRLPYSGNRTRATKILQIVHSDIKVFPNNKNTREGHKYFVTFIDDFSRYTIIYHLHYRSEITEKFQEYYTYMLNKFNISIGTLRCDGEYNSTELQTFCRGKGIVIEMTPRYSPELNGVAERMNRTLAEASMCLLIEGHLPFDFLCDAIDVAVHCRNRLYTKAVLNMTPYEAFFGKKPTYGHLKVFGCEAWAHIPAELRTKFDIKSTRCLMLGYNAVRRCYKLMEISSGKILFSRDVVFNESVFPGQELYTDYTVEELQNLTNSLNEIYPQNSSDSDQIKSQISSYPHSTLPDISITSESLATDFTEASNMGGDVCDVDISDAGQGAPVNNPEKGSVKKLSQKKVSWKRESDNCWTDESYVEPHSSGEKSPCDTIRTSKRIRGENPEIVPIRQFGYLASLDDAETDEFNTTLVSYALLSCETLISEPFTYSQAISGPNAKNWKEAIKSEYDSLMSNKTWEIVDIPQNRKAIKCKWIFKIKSDGRFKARLVAKGFTQKYGIDYVDTFAPVAKWDSIRLILSLAASKDWEIHQLDVSTAFLNGELEEEIYIEQPEGFVQKGLEHKVCKLKKSLYGLKQAPLVWNKALNDALIKSHFIRCVSDPCLYIHNSGRIIIAIYVDDIVITGESLKEVEAEKARLKTYFKMTDAGEMSTLL